jgi:hypothetical protein
MRVKNSLGAAWQILTDEQVRNPDIDLPNPSLRMISFTVTAPENGIVKYEVVFEP